MKLQSRCRAMPRLHWCHIRQKRFGQEELSTLLLISGGRAHRMLVLCMGNSCKNVVI